MIILLKFWFLFVHVNLLVGIVPTIKRKFSGKIMSSITVSNTGTSWEHFWKNCPTQSNEFWNWYFPYTGSRSGGSKNIIGHWYFWKEPADKGSWNYLFNIVNIPLATEKWELSAVVGSNISWRKRRKISSESWVTFFDQFTPSTKQHTISPEGFSRRLSV